MLQFYNEYSKNNTDARTADWFMMSSPIPSLIICFLYPIFVHLGKSYMKDRQPLQINKILVVYNFCLVICSVYMVYEYLVAGWLFDYNFSCQPVDKSNSPKAIRVRKKLFFLNFLNLAWRIRIFLFVDGKCLLGFFYIKIRRTSWYCVFHCSQEK